MQTANPLRDPRLQPDAKRAQVVAYQCAELEVRNVDFDHRDLTKVPLQRKGFRLQGSQARPSCFRTERNKLQHTTKSRRLNLFQCLRWRLSQDMKDFRCAEQSGRLLQCGADALVA